MNERDFSAIESRLAVVEGRFSTQQEVSKANYSRIERKVDDLYKKQEKFVEELHGLKFFIVKVAVVIAVLAVGGPSALLKLAAFF